MKDLKSFLEKVKPIHGNTFDYSRFEYINTKTKGIIICKTHGEFQQTPYIHSKGSGCPKCGFEKTKKATRLSKEQAITNFKKVHGETYDYSKYSYVNAKTKSTIICKTHGEFQQTYKDHVKGVGCPKCGLVKSINKRKKPVEIGIEKVKNKNKKYNYAIDFSNVVDYSSLVSITCKDHGTYHKSLSACQTTIQCLKCSQSSGNPDTLKSFVVKAKKVHGEKYHYETYIDSKTPIQIICPNHGAFYQRPNDHLNGCGCPKCVKKVSKEEDLIYENFKSFVRNDKSIIKPYHLDLVNVDSKLAIEVNGIYWHSEEKGKDKNYHLNKTKLANAQGYTLLHFWDKEINLKFPIVASMINSRIGNNKKVFAKTTEVRTVSKEEAVSFLNKNHLQGSCSFSIALGLYQESTLLMLITLGKPRFSKDHDYEIIRMCSLLNHNVVGGFSKLLSAFKKEYTPNSIITYADRRYSEGNAYEKCGFVKSHETHPNYFWYGNNQELPRYKTQKHKLKKLLGDKFQENLSEVMNMQNAGYSRVFDCGNLVYEWKNRP